MRRSRTCIACAALATGIGLTAGCGAGPGDGAARWAGTIDTLASGQIVVTNPAEPLWRPGEAWRVEEVRRIGRMEGDGPDVFGAILTFAADPLGRIWVVEDQAQEIRVFAPTGEHVRTIGRKGGGPGEFSRALRIDFGPDGNAWVADPLNARVSVFDSMGVYLTGHPIRGGFLTFPWPGGFDDRGGYYVPTPAVGSTGFRTVIVRHDSDFAPTDTLEPPTDTRRREYFELAGSGGRMMAGVPFQGGLVSRLTRRGTFLALVTDEYRLFDVAPNGDTLRTVTRPFQPLRVTDADLDWVREELKWFTDQGGRIDWSKIPDTKPPVTDFFEDDAGHVWVELEDGPRPARSRFDVFDPEGRYLGVVEAPFRLQMMPSPIVRGDTLYGITTDELDVPYLVVARVVKGR